MKKVSGQPVKPEKIYWIVGCQIICVRFTPVVWNTTESAALSYTQQRSNSESQLGKMESTLIWNGLEGKEHRMRLGAVVELSFKYLGDEFKTKLLVEL